MIQEAINKTREYIKYNYINTDVSRCRRYNIALNEIVKIEKSQYKELKNRILNLNNKILECISNHEDEFYYLDNFIEQIPMFYKYFDEYGIEFTEDMKVIQCILVYHMYALGEDIKVNKNIIGKKIYLVSIDNKVKWVYADREKAEYKVRKIIREHVSLIPKIEEYEIIE